MSFRASVLSIAMAAIAILTVPAALFGQGYGTSSSLFAENAEAGVGVTRGISSLPTTSLSPAPFSRLSIGARVSPFGPGVQVTTYVASHLNLRATGNLFPLLHQFHDQRVQPERADPLCVSGAFRGCLSFPQWISHQPRRAGLQRRPDHGHFDSCQRNEFHLEWRHVLFGPCELGNRSHTTERKRSSRIEFHQACFHHHHGMGQYDPAQRRSLVVPF